MIDIEAIKKRNTPADLVCTREITHCFRCNHVKADIDALIREVEHLRDEVCESHSSQHEMCVYDCSCSICKEDIKADAKPSPHIDK